jgi:hypothetical protein
MLPSVLAYVFNPALSSYSFAVPAGGQYARQAELEGADPSQQLKYGIVGGLTEALVEKVAFLKPLEKLLPPGIMSKVLKTGSNTMRKNLAHVALDTGKVMLGEATEEAVTDPITGLASKIIYDKDKKWTGDNGVFDFKQMGYDALIGGLMGGAFAAPTLPGNISEAVASKKYIDDNYDTTLMIAQGLPEEYASHKIAAQYTQNKYPVSYNELVELQKQVEADVMDYAAKVTPGETTIMEQTEPVGAEHENNTAIVPAQAINLNEPATEQKMNKTEPAEEQVISGVEPAATAEPVTVSKTEFVKGDRIIDNQGREWIVIGTKNKNMLDIQDASGKKSKIGRNVAVKIVEPVLSMKERNYENVTDRKVKSYQSEYPQLKEEIQGEAKEILYELDNTVKGERYPLKDENGSITVNPSHSAG